MSPTSPRHRRVSTALLVALVLTAACCGSPTASQQESEAPPRAPVDEHLSTVLLDLAGRSMPALRDEHAVEATLDALSVPGSQSDRLLARVGELGDQARVRPVRLEVDRASGEGRIVRVSDEDGELDSGGTRGGDVPGDDQPGPFDALEPVVEDKVVPLPDGGEVRSRTSTDLQIVDGRIRQDASQLINTSSGAGTGALDQTFTIDLAACPDVEGVVSGSARRTIVIDGEGEAGAGRVTVSVEATIVGRVNPARALVSFDLLDVRIDLVIQEPGARDQIVRGYGSRRGVGPGDEDGRTESRMVAGDTELRRTGQGVFDAALREFTYVARNLMERISTVSDHGVCVRVEVDRHGRMRLGPGEAAPLTATVREVATGQLIDAPTEALAWKGAVSPSAVPSTPADYLFRAPSAPSTYEVIVSTDGIRGGHTLLVVFGEGGSWKIDTTVGPFQVTGLKCDGTEQGPWEMQLSADFDGGVFAAEVQLEIRGDEGFYSLEGQTVGGGAVVSQHGSGTMRFVEDEDGSAHLEILGESWGSFYRFGGGAGDVDQGGRIPLIEATSADCGGSV